MTGRSNGWSSTPPSRRRLLLAALVAALLALTVLQPAPTPGPFARDFEAYYAAGATWNAGGDPWSRAIWTVERTIPGVVASRDEFLPFVGPAASLPLWSVLARLPFPLARAVWIAFAGIAFAAFLLAALRLSRPRSSVGDAFAVALLAVVSGPAISGFALGQVALVSAAGCALTLLALERGSPWAIGGAVVAALQPNLALPLAARLIDRRAILWLGLAAGLFAALTLAVGGGLHGASEYAHRLASHGAAERFASIQHTLPAVLVSFGVLPERALRLAVLTGLALAVLVGVTAWALRERPVLGVAIATALLPLAIPFFHEHDFVLLLLPVLVLSAGRAPAARTLASLAAVAILVDWFGLAQRPQAEPQIAAVALALALTLAALGIGERFTVRDLAPPALAIVLLAVAIPLARGNPAPTWPDTLGAAYAAAPHADASAVWADEQRRAGLDRTVPAWGVLRAIPLAGCALLALAGLVEARPRRQRA